MKTCPYCGSHIERMDHQYYYCDFCCMNIDIRIVKENSERLDVRFRDFVLAAQIDKTTPEITEKDFYSTKSRFPRTIRNRLFLIPLQQ
jgi:hypothetical protein